MLDAGQQHPRDVVFPEPDFNERLASRIAEDMNRSMARLEAKIAELEPNMEARDLASQRAVEEIRETAAKSHAELQHVVLEHEKAMKEASAHAERERQARSASERVQMDTLQREMFLTGEGVRAEAESIELLERELLEHRPGPVNLGRFEMDLPYDVLERKKGTFCAAVRRKMSEFAMCHREDIELLLAPGLRPAKPFEMVEVGGESGGEQTICVLYVRGPLNKLDCASFQQWQIRGKNRIFSEDVCLWIEDPAARYFPAGSRPADLLARENVRLRGRLSDVTNHAYYLEVFQKLCNQYEHAIDALRLKDEVLPELQRLQPVVVREKDAHDGRERGSAILRKLFREGVVAMPEWIDEGAAPTERDRRGLDKAALQDGQVAGTGPAVVVGEGGVRGPDGGEPAATAGAAAGGAVGGVLSSLLDRPAVEAARPGNKSTRLARNDLGSRYKQVGDVLRGDDTKCWVLGIFCRKATNVPAADQFSLSDCYIQLRLRRQKEGDEFPGAGPTGDGFEEADGGVEQEERMTGLKPGDNAEGLETFHFLAPGVDAVDPDEARSLNLVDRRAIATSKVINDSEFPEWNQVIEADVRDFEVNFADLVVELVLLDSDGFLAFSDDAIGCVRFRLTDYCEMGEIITKADEHMKALVSGRSTSEGLGPDDPKRKARDAHASILDCTHVYGDPKDIGKKYTMHTLPLRPLVELDEETGRQVIKAEFDVDRVRLVFGCLWTVQDIAERQERASAKADRTSFWASVSGYFGGGEEAGGEKGGEGDEEESGSEEEAGGGSKGGEESGAGGAKKKKRGEEDD